MTRSVLGRVARAAAAVILATTVVVGGAAVPAYASSWGFADFMEIMEPGTNLPENRFFFESDNENTIGQFQKLSGTTVGTHSGAYAAKLGQYWALASWISVGRTVRVTPKGLGWRTQCKFTAWVRGNAGARYNIEVINPSTWNYISVSHVTQPVGLTWSPVSTAVFTVPVTDIVLRVAFLPPAYGDAVFVDDFSLVCTY